MFRIYVLICLQFIASYECVNYTQYALYRAYASTENQLNYLLNLTALYEVDFWREPGLLDMPVEFVMDPQYRSSLFSDVDNMNINMSVLIEDIQEAFDKQVIRSYDRRKVDSFSWSGYYRLDDIYQWLRDMEDAHRSEMEVLTIGQSHEGRDILAVKIRLFDANVMSKVVVEGGIHAREWISPCFVTFFLHQILNSQSSNDSVLKKIANRHEWLFIPVLNPDGYEYTHTTDRMWRKNRKPYGEYVGVDLNRNFDVAFSLVGVGLDVSEAIYCGPEPFSEPESRALEKFIRENTDLKYYFSFHAYGQYMIIPYTFTEKHLDNYNEVLYLCKEAKTAIARRYGTKYTLGTAQETVGYMTSGATADWVKKNFNVPVALFFELRDTGKAGFTLETNEIEPTCWETMDGMLAILDAPPHKTRVDNQMKSDTNKAMNVCSLLMTILINVFFSIILQN